MSQQNEEPIAQFVDRFLQRTAIGVLLLGVAFAVSAAMYLVTESTALYLDKLTLLLGLIAIIVVLPGFIKLMRLKKNKQCDWSGSDSYMSGVFNKACVSAFEATFIFLIILEPVTKKYLTNQPTDFFINVILSLSAGVLGLAFFYRMRKDTAELEDDFTEGP